VCNVGTEKNSLHGQGRAPARNAAIAARPDLAVTKTLTTNNPPLRGLAVTVGSESEEALDLVQGPPDDDTLARRAD
jgi:hypothetical protein